MGCCAVEKGLEEEEIIANFNKILKENEFDFNIKNYKENYNKISKLSGNNFKKLCKKQNVRVAFLTIIRKDRKITTYSIDKKEDMEKILYYIIILTLLLENKIEEENPRNDIANNLINLKIELITHGYNLFNLIIKDINYMKNIIYYLSKLFYLCFKDFDNSNNYISIKAYITNIQFIVNNNCLEDEEEYYIFIRDNIFALGQFFHYNNNIILSEEGIINILTAIYSNILFHHYEYLISNYSLIKENINKNIRNTTMKLMNYNNNISNENEILPNITQTFDLINSFSVNMKNDHKDFKDINLIIESLYYSIKVSSQDIYSGKNLLKIFSDKLKEKNIENKKEDNKFIDIIYLLFFYECCIKDDEKITLCLLEYITGLFLSNDSIMVFNENNINYDIILDSYYLIYKNETLTKQYISLLSQIFIKEIENNCQNSLLLSQLIQIYYRKGKMINKIINLFFNFLMNISQYYNEKMNIVNNNENIISNEDNNNITIINDILLNLNSIIITYFINNTGFSSFINGNNNYKKLVSTSSNITHNIYDNKDNTNNSKINLSDYNIIIRNFFNFNDLKEINDLNNIEFFLYFHSFLITHAIDFKELVNDFSKKDKIYHYLFKIITKLEIMLIQISDKENNYIKTGKEEIDKNDYTIYINDIMLAISLILKIIEINDSKYYIQDCYILYKELENNIQSLLELQKLNENGNNEIDCFNLKIIYSIIFFILIQFIRLIQIPNSIIKNHKEILECINKSNSNERLGNYLSKIEISNFNLYNNSIKPNIQYLKEILFYKENKEQSFINYNSLKQILDIIYSKLFGKDTSLNIFFDNQIMNSKYFYNVDINSYNRSGSKASNVTEIKDNSVLNKFENELNENYIDEISIHIVESKNKIKNSINNENDNLQISKDSKIKIPSNNDISTDERILSNSITNDENLFNKIKI